ncbi:MAG: HAD family hydrolase, partial [Flavobacteriaceae bacterium]
MIKNIIFDFGGVFIDLDKEATARMLIGRGVAGMTPDLLALFEEYEKGIISTDIFLRNSKKWVPKANTPELIEAWNAILLDFPDYRLEFLEGLSREGSYRLFLLSNTNALHLESVVEKMGKERFHRFTSSFEYCYFSHIVNMRKPDTEIFEHVL